VEHELDGIRSHLKEAEDEYEHAVNELKPLTTEADALISKHDHCLGRLGQINENTRNVVLFLN